MPDEACIDVADTPTRRTPRKAKPDGATGVVLVITALEYGGAERQLVQLALGLTDRGFRVEVIALRAGGALAGELQRQGVPVRALGGRSILDKALFPMRLVAALRGHRPVVVYGFLPAATVPLALLRPLYSPVVLLLGVRSSALVPQHYGAPTRAMIRLEPALARFADAVVCNSYAGADDARARGMPPDRLMVVPNGVDTDRFRPDPDLRAAFRGELGVDGATTVVGLVGRVHPMKGHDVFLRAAARLRAGASAGERYVFVCVGDGDGALRREMERLAGALELGDRELRWLPGRSDPEVVLNGLDLLVSASVASEGTANVVLEAMACGTRCVATDVGDAARIVPPELGIVVPPGNPEVLAAACRSVLRRPFDAEVATRLRRHVVASYATSTMVTRTTEIIEDILAARSVRTPRGDAGDRRAPRPGARR